MPKLFESYDVIGKVKEEFNLPNAIVTAGEGDNAAAAIGTGTVRNGDCNISLGTSGTIFIAQDNFFVDKNNSLHSFAHANGRYHLMGCILSAASCNKWWTALYYFLRRQRKTNSRILQDERNRDCIMIHNN